MFTTNIGQRFLLNSNHLISCMGLLSGFKSIKEIWISITDHTERSLILVSLGCYYQFYTSHKCHTSEAWHACIQYPLLKPEGQYSVFQCFQIREEAGSCEWQSGRLVTGRARVQISTDRRPITFVSIEICTQYKQCLFRPFSQNWKSLYENSLLFC